VGQSVNQKNNTHAEQLKKKLLMLQGLIKADTKKKELPKKEKQSKTRKNKQQRKHGGTKTMAVSLKNAKDELKDREDQLQLLNDMLRSSTHQITMKDSEIQRLKKITPFF